MEWRSLQVAAAVAVVPPFGYGITGTHNDVLISTVGGLAVGVGLNLRTGRGTDAPSES